MEKRRRQLFVCGISPMIDRLKVSGLRRAVGFIFGVFEKACTCEKFGYDDPVESEKNVYKAFLFGLFWIEQ